MANVFATHATTNTVSINGETWKRVFIDDVKPNTLVRRHTGFKVNGLHKGFAPSQKIQKVTGDCQLADGWCFGEVWILDRN